MNNQIIKKILNILNWILITFLVIILIFNLVIIFKSKKYSNEVPSIFGYKPFIVMSGSMEDEFGTGDLVVVKNTDPKSLKINDIIAYRKEDYVITHRIVSVIKKKDDYCFKTKGDNNNVNDDGMVCSAEIEGKYIKKYAYVGSIILFIQDPYVLVSTIIIIILSFTIIIILSNDDNNNNKNGKNNKSKKIETSNKELKENDTLKKKTTSTKSKTTENKVKKPRKSSTNTSKNKLEKKAN